MIKAILFDFDGVVVQSEPLHLRSFRELFGPMGINLSPERWYSQFTGIGSPAIIRILFNDFNIREDVPTWVEKRKKHYQKLVLDDKLKPMKGIRRFLHYLKKKGIKTAIVSGGHSENIQLVLKKLKLEGLFDSIVSVESVQNRKPHPEGFLLAAKRLGVKPSECIAIEDSPSGINAAHAAKMTVMCVQSPAPVDKNKCNYTIKDFIRFPKDLIK
ncbi:MAG TPA: HAD family phosphatase [Candidatus Bilamarchaeaceae archaeon]|nr:HAD family phosphatase [Candidatus Bilamarchaeaceae archaeon]